MVCGPRGAGRKTSQAWDGQRVVGKEFRLLVHPLLTFCIPSPRYPGHAPVSVGTSDSQWDRVCSVLPSLFCPDLLICVIRLRLPAPGLFLLLSSPCWAGSSASPIGATWPGERSPPELFLGFLQSLSEEPSAFDVCRRRVLDDVTAPSILYPVALLGDGHHASAP